LNFKIAISILFVCFSLRTVAQHNSIKISAELDTKTDVLKIQQEIVYYNKTSVSLSEIYLHNWGNSFKNKETLLTDRFIEGYDKSLYFAKEDERGFSKIANISVNHELVQFSSDKKQIDIVKIVLNKPLQPKDSIRIIATYTLKFPSAKFTGYGKTTTGYHLRFWYLTPAIYNTEWQRMSNLDMDDLYMDIANYDILLKAPKKFVITSNLTQTIKENKETTQHHLKGVNKTDVLINITTQKNFNTYKTDDFEIVTNVLSKNINHQITTNILNREIDFIKQYLGEYPLDKMLIDKITQRKNPIYGLNQLPSFLNPFSEIFEWDLTLFKALTKKYIENTLLFNKRSDYWLADGIQTFLMMEYVKKYYPEIKLLGKVSTLWGVRSFNISKLNFNDKYPFVYQFSTRRFLDQALTTPADSLSNFNRNIAGKYKAGLGLQYLKGYLGEPILKSSLKEFYQKNKLKLSYSNSFEDIIKKKTTKNLTWFFGNYIQTNKKIDYTIKKVNIEKDSLKITIKNKRNITAPVALYGVKDKKIKLKKWFTGIDSVKTVSIAKGDFDKISLNYEQIYPEYNSLDNWKNVGKSVFNKPVQFKFFTDIEDPYYHQIFYQPVFSYNYYDGISLGIKLHNKPILYRNFIFKAVPTYATKSNNITGIFSVIYNQYLEDSKIRRISYGLLASNSHYAPDLAYNTFVPFVSVQFKRKSLRDIGGSSLTAKLVNINKEKGRNTLTQEQDKYSVLNLGYSYSKPDIIKEIRYKINTEFATNFTKFSADFRYRKLTGKNRQLDFRFFGGFFLNNKTTGNYFSFGLDRASDYLFEQNFFGRSESSGIFSQQIIIDDGGFKSKLPVRFANQFMTSFNSSIGIWKWMEYYTDVALLKNKGNVAYFAYENGIRFNFIHNILEFYFPLYSNLGWEVNQAAYPSRIRFVLTARPSAIYNFFRRGFL